jgi:hypothetical protein
MMLEEMGDSGPSIASVKRLRPWLPWSIAAGLTFPLLVFIHFRAESSVPEVVCYQIALPDEGDVAPNIRLLCHPMAGILLFLRQVLMASRVRGFDCWIPWKSGLGLAPEINTQRPQETNSKSRGLLFFHSLRQNPKNKLFLCGGGVESIY